MSSVAFITHVVFALSLTVISAALTRIMVSTVRIMDVPNARSSHVRPTPKSGGIAIVCTFATGLLIIWLVADKSMIAKPYFTGFVFSALLIAGISFYDDVTGRAFVTKVLTQIIAVVAVLAAGIVVDRLALPFVGFVDFGLLAYPLSFLWVMGLTNAYNFMDGLDGLAAGTAVIVSTFFCAITFSQGSLFVYITCYTVLAGSLGLLIYNFPPAKIFMGDVGSAFLGFTFAVLAIMAARYDHSHTSFLVMPLLLFHFIYDTLLTFIRRLLRGENVLEAHRTHLYQLFNRLGYSHRFVTLFLYVVCIAQGVAATIMVQVPGPARMLFFVPFLLFQVSYSIWILRHAHRAGLLRGADMTPMLRQ